ncbi:FRG domain-containing protein [Photobacterium leiognathi]|uniref:FRG domain-containing protein n=1 Tax=Photobacterium leiognathi TaxID=553611 RepID=UPI00273A374A|nr:FRG domain-containing protein [Photobacterium leiognathi]
MPIYEENFESVSDLWQHVSPISPFVEKLKFNTIYRGQADSEWDLTPGAFRQDVISKYRRNKQDYKRYNHVIEFEYFNLNSFLIGCDQQGIQIPFDSNEFREAMEFTEFVSRYGSSSDDFQWPDKEYYPLLAKAQHHGMPTRLLDWTKSSLVAMYFAATQALYSNNKSERMAIWVIDAHETILSSVGLDLIQTAGSVSKNLAAQKGLFLLYKEPKQSYKDDFYPELESSVINKLLAQNNMINVYKFTLPTSLAGELYMLCYKFNVSATTLFPGPDGVAKGVLEFDLAKRSAGIL